jgi:hypothetical protein
LVPESDPSKEHISIWLRRADSGLNKNNKFSAIQIRNQLESAVCFVSKCSIVALFSTKCTQLHPGRVLLHKAVRALIEACLHECITTASELKSKLIKVFLFFFNKIGSVINCNNFKNAPLGMNTEQYTAKTKCRKFETNIPRKGI